MTDSPEIRQAPADAVVLPFRGPVLLSPQVATPEQIINALHEAWSEKLAAYAFKKTGDQDDADDLVSLVFMDLWNRHVAQGREPKVGYMAFLFGAMNNRLESRKRKHARRSRLLEASDYVANLIGGVRNWMLPAHRAEANEFERIVKNALLEMTPRCADLQLLHRHSGMSVSEIAEALQISTETVSSLLQKGNRILRQHLAKTRHSPEGRRIKAHGREKR